jgi:methylamine dehydrogenase heavy chain
MLRSDRCTRWTLSICAFAALLAGSADADLPLEPVGRVATVKTPYSPHWVFVGDALGQRTALVDVEDGRMLGTLDSGFGIPQTLQPSRRSEIYVIETHYSRGSRGERSDVLTIYDKASLAAIAEVALPPKRALSATPVAHAALSDDDRFAAIFNLTPATSLSIVDLEQRRFVAEIQTPGCSLVYPIGDRRFASLCMNGSVLVVRLDDSGREIDKQRSEPFFDPERDPVTEKAARFGSRWLFPSYDGWIHPVDFSGPEPIFDERWSLTSEREREAGWKIGGYQHLAVHEPSATLYALMHVGEADSHKQNGSEVWFYDLAKRERSRRVELVNPGFTYLGVPIEGGPTWGWLVDWIGDRIMHAVPDIGVDSIAVTHDDAPRLVTSGMFSGGIATFDALSGDFVGRVFSGNLTNVALQAARPASPGSP